MQIFYGEELRDFLEAQAQRMKGEILGEEKNYLLNCNEVEYIKHMVCKYKVEPIVFDWDEMQVSDCERSFRVDDYGESRTLSKQVISYHIPYTGDRNLLSLMPSTRLLWTYEVTVSDNSICFDIVNWSDNLQEIKREADNTTDSLKKQVRNVVEEVNQYNKELENKITKKVKDRKAELLKQSDLLANLGVPMKKSQNVPNTFTIPAPKKKTIIAKPIAPSTCFQPEPTLDGSTYNDILRICHDAGVEIERHPSIYKGKDEETLRDHFLMVLSPHFQSATGETFNKSGKTDILIRHDGKNAFVAECKFWRGIKGHYQTIDQILGNLTWRDSKAAILCFIKNKELNPVLEQIESETCKHECFVKYDGKTANSQFNFHFHLKEDSTRGVELAILCFHFPE